MLSGSPAIESELDTCVKAEYLCAAESVLAKPVWLDLKLLDMSQLTSMCQTALAPPPAEVPAAPAAPAPAQEPAQQLAQQVPQDQDFMPNEEAVEAPETPPVDSLFPAICLNEVQRDILKRVEWDKVRGVVDWAKIRVRQHITVHVAEPLSAPAVHDGDCTRVLLWDLKTHLVNCSESAHKAPMRFSPPFEVSHAQKTMAAFFGSSAGESSLLRSCDIAFFFDGRLQTANADLSKQLKKYLKHLPKDTLPARAFMPFHFFYSNKEFHSGYLKPKSQRTTFSALLPSHVETAFVVAGKAFNPETRDRRWLDLPGNNRSRGWANCELLEENDHIMVPFATKAHLSCLSADAALKAEEAAQKAAEEEDGSSAPVSWYVSKTASQQRHPDFFRENGPDSRQYGLLRSGRI